MRRYVLVGVLSWLLTAAPRLGQAAELSARGPAECADTRELSFRVERSIGMPLAEAAPLQFDVEMKREASGYVARVTEGAGNEGVAGRAARQRVLGAADCERLADAVGIAIALALGGADAGPSEPGAGEPRATTAAVPVATSAASPPPANSATDAGAAGASSRAERWLPSLSLWLLADAGSLPAPGLGAALGAELSIGRLQVRALGTLLFEQHTQVENTLAPGAGAKLELLAGSLLACTAPLGRLRSQLASLACLGMELGQLTGEGTGVPDPRRGSALWAAPRVDLGGFWTIPGSALRLGLSLMAAIPLNRDEFALNQIGTVHQPPSVVGRMSLGIDLAFE
jgi:hypothetical protein